MSACGMLAVKITVAAYKTLLAKTLLAKTLLAKTLLARKCRLVAISPETFPNEPQRLPATCKN